MRMALQSIYANGLRIAPKLSEQNQPTETTIQVDVKSIILDYHG